MTEAIVYFFPLLFLLGTVGIGFAAYHMGVEAGYAEGYNDGASAPR